MEYANLRPFGIGEVLDAALRIYRKRFGALVIAVAFVVVPLQVVQVLFQISRPAERTIFRSQGQLFVRSGPSPNTAFALLLVTVLVSLFTTALAQGASMRIIADQYLGTQTSWSASLRAALKQIWSLLWVGFLASLCWVLGIMACGIPGVYLYVAFSVAIPVLLMEGTKGSKALGRSRRLVSGRWWPTFAALVVVALLSYVLTLLAALLVGGSTILGGGASTSTGVTVMQGALNALIAVFTTPMTAAVATVIYFDLRVRKEGFDIALMTQRLEAAPVPASCGPATFPTTMPTPTPTPTPAPDTDLSWSAPVRWPPPDATTATDTTPPSPRSPWADEPPPTGPPSEPPA